jgi:transposase
MKTKNESDTAVVRNKYTAQFKEQVLERADKDGIAKVAKDLGLAESMLYNWRAKRSQTGQPFEDQKLQQAEMARLKREYARLEEEVAFLKNRLPGNPAPYEKKQFAHTLAWRADTGRLLFGG